MSLFSKKSSVFINEDNSIQFSLFYTAKYDKLQMASKGFTVCTHTTSLTFDLTSDQEKLPRNRKKTFYGGKREEPFRRTTEEDPSAGWTEE